MPSRRPESTADSSAPMSPTAASSQGTESREGRKGRSGALAARLNPINARMIDGALGVILQSGEPMPDRGEAEPDGAVGQKERNEPDELPDGLGPFEHVFSLHTG